MHLLDTLNRAIPETVYAPCAESVVMEAVEGATDQLDAIVGALAAQLQISEAQALAMVVGTLIGRMEY